MCNSLMHNPLKLATTFFITPGLYTNHDSMLRIFTIIGAYELKIAEYAANLQYCKDSYITPQIGYKFLCKSPGVIHQ